jgi:predicted amidohydrolase/GNAT superfamily N-acetyltransferase
MSENASAGADPSGVTVRRALPEDAGEIFRVQRAAYPSMGPASLCSERQIGMQIEAFPDGQFVAEFDGRVIGYASSLIVTLDDESPWHSYDEITGYGTFSSHTPSGDTLYGADVAVDPAHRGRGVAGALYRARKRLLDRFNLRRMVAGGRIPGYREHAGTLTAEEYVEKVVAGELADPALNAHLKAGYRVKGIHLGYMKDAESLDYATFIELPNPDFKPERRRIASAAIRRPVRRVRVCAAQYQMRRISSWEEFEHQVDFFAHTADEYHSHFLLFPELFTVQLFSTMPPRLESREAMSRLADLTPRYIELMRDMAQTYGLHIVGGSQPVRTEKGLRNVAHLITPRGNVYTQDKLHVTPAEREEYGIQPGEGLRVFDTGLARVAILVCYDVEFPELARLLTLAGAEVLLVPYSTDERRGYLRVRYSAQARAVENIVFVAMAGNVGNLPQVDSFLINYGQAAVLTPSDFAFPVDGIAACGEPNSETVVIADLDLATLDLQREVGTVRPLRALRPDLYTLTARTPVEVIRTV